MTFFRKFAKTKRNDSGTKPEISDEGYSSRATFIDRSKEEKLLKQLFRYETNLQNDSKSNGPIRTKKSIVNTKPTLKDLANRHRQERKFFS